MVCPRISSEHVGRVRRRRRPTTRTACSTPTSTLDGGGQARGQDARRPPLAVLDVAPALAAGPLAGLRVGVMHGKLHPDEKDRVMTAFAAGQLDVLVSTTVIEVGVDVPNATAMVIMDAERFGVSQLHQLRGRVGRGAPRRAVPAGDRGARRQPGQGAARRGGRDRRRVPALPPRPGAAARGRRARLGPGGPPQQPEAAAAAGRRGPDRLRPGGGDGPGRGRPAAHRASGASRRRSTTSSATAGPSSSTRPEPARSCDTGP